jgi:hypothetical protein
MRPPSAPAGFVGLLDGEIVFEMVRSDVVGRSDLRVTPSPTDRKAAGQIVAILHKDGQEAVDRFCEQYKEELEQLKKALRSTGNLVEPLAALRRCDRDAVI